MLKNTVVRKNGDFLFLCVNFTEVNQAGIIADFFLFRRETRDCHADPDDGAAELSDHFRDTDNTAAATHEIINDQNLRARRDRTFGHGHFLQTVE